MALVTNVVAQRVVRDVVQTLLALTPTGNTAALGAQGSSPLSMPPAGQGSNTVWEAMVKQARAGGFTLLTNADSAFRQTVSVGGHGLAESPRLITNTFAGFVAGSLADTIWSSLHLEGRNTKLWEFWQLPAAISQVREGEGAFGQGSITALTRRHGYLRGHGMGPSGLHPEKVGVRVWFCTRDNQVIERKVKLLVTRFMDEGKVRDYSIILFDADLPATIEPMRVTDPDKVKRKYLFDDLSHKPVMMSLQGGFVTAGVAEWTVPVAGGDSGAPRMLPLGGELVFLWGISTSPPSAEMQADMDMLSLKAGLDPRRYQMQWVDLDSYPDF